MREDDVHCHHCFCSFYYKKITQKKFIATIIELLSYFLKTEKRSYKCCDCYSYYFCCKKTQKLGQQQMRCCKIK
jgi:hypothetical protein